MTKEKNNVHEKESYRKVIAYLGVKYASYGVKYSVLTFQNFVGLLHLTVDRAMLKEVNGRNDSVEVPCHTLTHIHTEKFIQRKIHCKLRPIDTHTNKHTHTQRFW